MKTPQPAAATIMKWLRGNKLNLAALTGHDTAALLAATQVASLWARGDHTNREHSAQAFAACVNQMQPTTRWIAYHVVAHSADWSHRIELWTQARLQWPTGCQDCSEAPREFAHTR